MSVHVPIRNRLRTRQAVVEWAANEYRVAVRNRDEGVWDALSEMSQREIAETLGVAPQRVSQMVARARVVDRKETE